jgi:hypothetical protein
MPAAGAAPKRFRLVPGRRCGSPMEIAGGRAKAKEFGLIIVRDTSMIARVRTCGSITTVGKAKAEA